MPNGDTLAERWKGELCNGHFFGGPAAGGRVKNRWTAGGASERVVERRDGGWGETWAAGVIIEDSRTRRRHWKTWARCREEKRGTARGRQGEEPASGAGSGPR